MLCKPKALVQAEVGLNAILVFLQKKLFIFFELFDCNLGHCFLPSSLGTNIRVCFPSPLESTVTGILSLGP